MDRKNGGAPHELARSFDSLWCLDDFCGDAYNMASTAPSHSKNIVSLETCLVASSLGAWKSRKEDYEKMAEENSTLPYRTTGEDIERFLFACARGRDMDKIRSLYSSTSTFQGTVSAADELGLFDSEAAELTDAGKKFAMGGEKTRKRSLSKAILRYEPYELLLEAAFGEGIQEEEGRRYTTIEWVEMWWSTNGYGSSQTNRSEGSSAFGYLLSYAGLGAYKQGRRGHPSRIEWMEDSEDRLREVRQELVDGFRGEEEKEDELGGQPDAVRNESSEEGKGRAGLTARPNNNVLTMNLGNDRVAELSLPSKLSTKEKERLLSLVELMIATENENSEVQMQMDL